MADLATQDVAASGTAPTFDPANATDTAEIGSGTNTFVVYKNTDAASRTITIPSDLTLDSGADYPDRTYTLAATNGELWIPLIRDYDGGGAATAGRAELNVAPAVAGVTVAVVRRS